MGGAQFRNYRIHAPTIQALRTPDSAPKRSDSSTKKSRFKHQKEPIPAPILTPSHTNSNTTIAHSQSQGYLDLRFWAEDLC